MDTSLLHFSKTLLSFVTSHSALNIVFANLGTRLACPAIAAPKPELVRLPASGSGDKGGNVDLIYDGDRL